MLSVFTRELPWLTLVEINFSYGSTSEGAVKNLLEKVVSYELLICRVEPKTRWQVSFSVVQVVVGRVVHWREKNKEHLQKREMKSEGEFNLSRRRILDTNNTTSWLLYRRK